MTLQDLSKTLVFVVRSGMGLLCWMCGLMGVSSSYLFASDAREGFEERSWLDTESKLYVLQNRKYRKAPRPYLSVSPTIGLSDPYNRVFGAEGRAGLYFTETWGLEGFAHYVWNDKSANYAALRQVSQVIPLMRETRATFGGLLHFSPFYAKINLFDSIVYFDWNLQAGAGAMLTALDTNNYSASSGSTVAIYRDEMLFAGFVGTGQQFHINQTFFVRWDLLATIFHAQDDPSLSSYTRTQLNASIGLGVRL